MKRFANTAVALVVIAMGTWALADHHEGDHTEEPWFDMQKCACCKHMGENMDMMKDIKWENHTLENGGMMTAVIPDEHKKRWDAVCKKMEATIEDMESGEEMPTCNFCKSYMKLMEAGANIEEVETGFGMVTLITSDKADVVDMIHKHIKRTQKESEKMEKMMEHAAG